MSKNQGEGLPVNSTFTTIPTGFLVFFRTFVPVSAATTAHVEGKFELIEKK